jgi:prefoldin subunit 5
MNGTPGNNISLAVDLIDKAIEALDQEHEETEKAIQELNKELRLVENSIRKLGIRNILKQEQTAWNEGHARRELLEDRKNELQSKREELQNFTTTLRSEMIGTIEKILHLSK